MTRLESDHHSSMELDPQHARELLRHYVPLFKDRGPVLELGRGRGGFLGLLEEAGVEAQGVDVLAFLDGGSLPEGGRDPAPGSYQGVFCDHVVEHLTPDQVRELLAGVRRVLAPGGRFVTVTPNPACYQVLSRDFWRDPTHVRLYDLPLLELLCRQAGLEVEESGTNPASHPGLPPEYLVQEPVVHPPLGDLVERSTGKLRASLDHHRRGRANQPHDPDWAYELTHVVKVLADRLQEATEALREVHRAYGKLVQGLYQSNETYVVARG